MAYTIPTNRAALSPEHPFLILRMIITNKKAVQEETNVIHPAEQPYAAIEPWVVLQEIGFPERLVLKCQYLLKILQI
jgi:hypothetical protein